MINEITHKIQHLVNRGEAINESEIVHLLTLCGKAVERKGLENKYPIVKFFRDWVQHTNIEWSKTGLDMLLKMQQTIVTVDSLKNHSLMLKAISGVLSFEHFRIELKGLLVHLGVATDSIDSDAWWRIFMSCMISILKDCPIQFPLKLNANAKYARDIYEKIMSIPFFGKVDGVIGLAVTVIDGKTYGDNHPHSDRLVANLAIKLKSTTTILASIVLSNIDQTTTV